MIYIALLRGINIGKKNRIKMEDLRTALAEIGLNDIKTYIQSGNIIFKSDETKEKLEVKIENMISDKFSISIDVVLRTHEEFKDIIENIPFSKDEIESVKSAEYETLYTFCLMGVLETLNL